MLGIKDFLGIGENWYKSIEFYHDDLKSCFYTFDNIDHLKEILKNPVVDIRNIREKCMNLIKDMEIPGLVKWREILVGNLN